MSISHLVLLSYLLSLVFSPLQIEFPLSSSYAKYPYPHLYYAFRLTKAKVKVKAKAEVKARR